MSLCISTVVDSKYMAYLPLFVWCCRKVYPSYTIKLFLRDECPYKVKGAELVQSFKDFPRFTYNSIALRFVVPPTEYAGFDYVYVTDIDIMIMPERISIEDFHKGEMVASGLNYSNSLRNVHHYCGAQSLSGLHFASKRWFVDTEKERFKYYNLLKEGVVGLYREYDGLMLYRMIENSGLRLPGKYNLKKRHHGIHLGNFRLFDSKEKWADRIPVEYRNYWREWCSDPEFKEILKVCRNDNEMLDKQVEMLNDFIRNPK